MTDATNGHTVETMRQQAATLRENAARDLQAKCAEIDRVQDNLAQLRRERDAMRELLRELTPRKGRAAKEVRDEQA